MNQVDRAIRPEKRVLTWVDVVLAGSGDPEAIAVVERHIDEPGNAPWLEVAELAREQETTRSEEGSMKDEC